MAYVELDLDARIPPGKSTGRPRSPDSISGKLRDGATLLLSYNPSGYHTQMGRFGYKLHERRRPDGWVIWADKLTLHQGYPRCDKCGLDMTDPETSKVCR